MIAFRAALAGAGLALAVGGLAHAQELSSSDILARMKAASGAPRTPPKRSATRSLSMENGVDRPSSLGAPPPPAPPPTPEPNAGYGGNWGWVVDLHSITFAVNSAQIEASSLPTLGALAKAMKDPAMANRVFLVVGHTDGTGGAAANLALSRKRADSVVKLLVRLGVPQAALFSDGKGSSMLLPGEPINGVANRRVEVLVDQS